MGNPRPVRLGNRSSRPSSVPPSITVPALLRAGHWVNMVVPQRYPPPSSIGCDAPLRRRDGCPARQVVSRYSIVSRNRSKNPERGRQISWGYAAYDPVKDEARGRYDEFGCLVGYSVAFVGAVRRSVEAAAADGITSCAQFEGPGRVELSGRDGWCAAVDDIEKAV